jgi:hypothetical protein
MIVPMVRRAAEICLWGVGVAVLAGPILAAVWTPNRDDPFYCALAVSVAVGLVAGWLSCGRNGTLAMRLERLPSSLLVAAGWPVSVLAALTLETASSNTDLTVVGWFLASAVAVVLGALPLAARFGSRRPHRSLSVLGMYSTVAAAVLVFMSGIGLAVLPSSVATWLAGRTLTRRRLSSSAAIDSDRAGPSPTHQ